MSLLAWDVRRDQELCVNMCGVCREYEQGQKKETLTSHEAPSRPWQFVAADLFELNGKSYLVTVDYFSDFFELDHLRSTSSVYVIKKLKGHFARHGIPEQLVTDNGPQFVSHDFLKFSKEWDFEHRTRSPHHSQSNGKAESAVKVQQDWFRRVSCFTGPQKHTAFQYANQPNTAAI